MTTLFFGIFLSGCWVPQSEVDAWFDAGFNDDLTAEQIVENLDFQSISPAVVYASSDGVFLQGCEPEIEDGNCSPAHETQLTHTFRMSRYEVSNQHFRSLLPDMDPLHDEKPIYAVVNVSWHDAAQYANLLSSAVGKQECYTCDSETQECVGMDNIYLCDGYRLPTEAEWELAAKCSTDFTYAGSDTASDVAIFAEERQQSTSGGGQKADNLCGIFDLSGNAAEWTHDDFTPYTEEAVTDPIGGANGETKVYRGGSFLMPANNLHETSVSSRSLAAPDQKMIDLGFRLVRTEE